jgi:hypothetical protein
VVAGGGRGATVACLTIAVWAAALALRATDLALPPTRFAKPAACTCWSAAAFRCRSPSLGSGLPPPPPPVLGAPESPPVPATGAGRSGKGRCPCGSGGGLSRPAVRSRTAACTATMLGLAESARCRPAREGSRGGSTVGADARSGVVGRCPSREGGRGDSTAGADARSGVVGRCTGGCTAKPVGMVGDGVR